MPSNQSRSLGPPWLCCSVCACGSLAFPSLVIGASLGLAPTACLVLGPFAALWSGDALHWLLTGRPPRSRISMAIDLLRVRGSVKRE